MGPFKRATENDSELTDKVGTVHLTIRLRKQTLSGHGWVEPGNISMSYRVANAKVSAVAEAIRVALFGDSDIGNHDDDKLET